MFKFVLLILASLGVLSLSELQRKRVGLRNEYARKTYHVVHGLLIGAAPFFVSYKIIIGFELLLLVEMLVVRKFKLLQWLHRVGRVSWGDVFTVAGVVVICLIKPNPWVFLAGMLHLALADTVAALVGKRFGDRTNYTVFGETKSLVGSLAFYVVSVGITLFVLTVTPLHDVPLSLVLLLPPLVTLAENIGVFGLDNFVIPVVVVTVLHLV